jgi:aminopeptidase YwaD
MPDDNVGSEIIAWTRRILEACGPRPAGSEACQKAAGLIAEDLKKHCDRTELQVFACHPLAFLGMSWLVAPLGIVAAALLFFGYPYSAGLVAFVAAAVGTAEFAYYRELVDKLFPKKKCTNVVGVIEPKGPAQRQIVVSAHHDSAFEFRYLRFKLLYVAVAGLTAFTVYAMPFVGGTVALLDVGFDVAPPVWMVRAMAVLAAVSNLLFLFFVKWKAVPGAGDNLVSCGMLVHAAAALRSRLAADPDALAGTRVILASCDAEEAGLRGSRAFVRDNRALLRDLPTVNLNLESFYQLKELSYLTSDINDTVKLSVPLGEAMAREAIADGLLLKPMRLHFGMGATDAAEFAKAGIPATCLLAIPTNPFAEGRQLYHTPHDVPENLEPAVIAAAARLILKMIDRVAKDRFVEALKQAA